MARKTLIGSGNDENLQVGGKKQKKAPKSVNKLAAVVIELVPISELRPAAYNPRRALKPGDPEFEKLRRSIEQFGLVDPPVWNRRTGNLVGGHQRLAVLKHLHPDITELAVSVVDLDLAQEKALNVALNKIEGGVGREQTRRSAARAADGDGGRHGHRVRNAGN